MAVVFQIIAAYILIDLLSGVYHLVTDKGFNVQNQVEMFLDHHDTNTMQDFDWQTFAVGMLVAVPGAWFHYPFLIACGVFLALTQVSHYYAHRKSKNEWVRAIVRGLQRSGLIVHPADHAKHHRVPHNQNFCLLSGWNNWWLNQLVKMTTNR